MTLTLIAALTGWACAALFLIGSSTITNELEETKDHLADALIENETLTDRLEQARFDILHLTVQRNNIVKSWQHTTRGDTDAARALLTEVFPERGTT